MKLTNLSKSFAGRFEPILQNVDLSLSPGEFCIVIGSNGSGKSTLLKCISGEYKIDHGNIDIDQSKVAAVAQDINKGTIPEMTCLENMMLSKMRSRSATLSLYYNHRTEMIAQLKELNIGLEHYIDQPLSNLSGGQRQMIATLMAINSKPEMLLLDEHTSALDPKTQKLLMEYTVKAIALQKITAMMVTHKLEDAVLYGDRLIMLHKGKIVLDVKGKAKQKFDVEGLFQLFHDYEVSHDK